MESELLGKFVGIQHEELNCYDLVRQIYIMIGICLPKSMYKISDYFCATETIDTFDIITFKVVPRFISHIGVYIGRDKFLHSTPKNGVTCERLSLWKDKIHGVYRYERNNINKSV